MHLAILLGSSFIALHSQEWEPQNIHDCEQIEFANQFLNDKSPWIAIIGGWQTTRTYYNQAQIIGYLLAQKGYSIITGSGGGIMEAANSGAQLANGTSLGIILEGEDLNDYISQGNYHQVSHVCHRLHSMLSCASGCVAFPGGLATLSELCFALDQFRYNNRPPIVLVGEAFWEPLFNWVKKLSSFSGHDNLFMVNTPADAIAIISSYHAETSSYIFSNP